MTKKEFYQAFIEVQKNTGQGLSGIVKVMGKEPELFALYLSQFIKEGLCVACDTGGGMGHPESNIFYMPTKGYNVWLDEGGKSSSRHRGKYLTHVRYYLGALTPDTEVPTGLDENDSNLRRALNPTKNELSKDKEFMKDYNEWLKKNKADLEEMINLEEDYDKVKSTVKIK